MSRYETIQDWRDANAHKVWHVGSRRLTPQTVEQWYHLIRRHNERHGDGFVPLFADRDWDRIASLLKRAGLIQYSRKAGERGWWCTCFRVTP